MGAPDGHFAAALQRLGGGLDRNGLSEDSALGAAWYIGEASAEVARYRLRAQATPSRIEVALGIRPALNAVATGIPANYGAVVFWPLVLVLQGVSAAMWSHPAVAPWIGDVAKLRPRLSSNATSIPGFDIYLGLIGKEEIDPSRLRSGLRKDDVDAIVSTGEDRWTAFLCCWNGALRFVWGHELAHILYGHVDIARSNFGLEDLYEAEDSSASGARPPELSQFMEHVADMDAAMNLFTSLYASASINPEDKKEWQIVTVATFIGMVLSIYVLEMARAFGRQTVATGTHPPLRHRACWLIGAENRALDALERRTGISYRTGTELEEIRELMRDALRGTAQVHESLWSHIANIDDAAEAQMNSYVTNLRDSVSPYFGLLDAAQKVR